MQRTYRVPLARAELAGLMAIAVLLACPGTSIAGGASESNRPAAGTGTVLQRGAGYHAASQRPSVRTVQRALRRLGWRPGGVDGLFGPQTEAAVEGLQAAVGVPVDGVVGPRTRQAIRQARAHVLRRGAGYAQAGGAPRVRRLQRELRRRGLRPGPVDGRFGPRTEAAVTRLQKAVRLPADGVVDTTTRRLLARTGVPVREIRADTTADYGRNRTLRMRRLAGAREEADTAATLATPLVGGAIVAALLIGMLMALLIVRRDVVGQVHALVLGRRGLTRRPEARYLVSDPGEAKPFWVGHDEITRLIAVKPARARSAPRAEPRVEGVRVLGYVSVPSVDGGDDARLRKQAAKIDALCEERGWRLVEMVRDVEGNNGKGLHRPGLRYALDRIEKGEASCLVVSHLGRLTRSAGDLGRILEWLKSHDGRLVAMDVGLDTGSRDGDVAADALMSVSVWERRRLGERTRKGLAAARARGASGRPAVSDVPELEARIVTMRSEGMTLQAIADQLNDEGVPTLRGGQKWRPSSVQAAAGYRRPGRRPEDEV